MIDLYEIFIYNISLLKEAGDKYMVEVRLTNELTLKKLDPNNQKDLWLIQQLNNDKTTLKYLKDIKHVFINLDYLQSSSLFKSPYSILYNDNPVGFIEVFELFRLKKMANLSYAILKEERGKGHAKTVLKLFSDILLCEAKKIELVISDSNKESQRVAINAGFYLQQQQYDDVGFKKYEKIKTTK